jgi:hypothetical protein
MTNQYVHVRMRKPDYDKIIREKKKKMEFDLSNIMGKPIRIKTIQLFSIAANSTWEFSNFHNQFLEATNKKRGKRIKKI